jgi:hypothetical protein
MITCTNSIHIVIKTLPYLYYTNTVLNIVQSVFDEHGVLGAAPSSILRLFIVIQTLFLIISNNGRNRTRDLKVLG